MFESRVLDGDLAAVRDEHAPGAIVLDVERDFEILSPAVAESLGPVVESIEPLSYPGEWVPTGAPDSLHRIASGEFTLGAPGDGGVTWTRQMTPPIVFVKPRLRGSPGGFVEFLIAEAFVEIGTGLPEQFLGFFEERYSELDAAIPFGPADTYQIAVALFDAYTGLYTRGTFADWRDDRVTLYEPWNDAGERLRPRLDELPEAVASGRTGFADAAEFACNALKHGLELPPPFAALDASVYRENGAAYAVQWAEMTFEKSADD